MTRNFYRLWFVLLIISGAITLWFSGIAVSGLWKFFRLNEQTPAQVLNWKIQELSTSRFALEAEYKFDLNGKTYSGKTIFERPQFLNRFAAEHYMKVNESKNRQTWYHKGKPAYHSLEKEFPKKPCLHALLTLGVFVYFFFVRTLVQRSPH